MIDHEVLGNKDGSTREPEQRVVTMKGKGLGREGAGWGVGGGGRRERMPGTEQGGGGFIILCSTQSNTGPLNREQRWRIILGAFSGFLPPLPARPPPFSPSLSIYFSCGV